MTIQDFKLWLLQLNEFSGLPGVLYFLCFMRSNIRLTHLIFIVLFLSIGADVTAYFFIRFVYPNSYIISNSWHLANFLVLILFFYYVLPSWRKTILTLAGAYLLTNFISFGWFYTFLDANPFVSVPSNLISIGLCLLAYRQMLNSPGHGLSQSPLFWFLTAIFVYSALTLFYHLFLQYLVFDQKISAFDISYISVINLGANISKNFIIFYVLVLIDKGNHIQVFKKDRTS